MDTYLGLLRTVWDILTQKWQQRHLPRASELGDSVEGQNFVVTGPTSGIGEQLAIQLAARGANLTLACRSLERGIALKARLEKQAVHQKHKLGSIEVRELDVADLNSVRRFAKAWLKDGRSINCLINNAGIFNMAGPRQVTKDGFEAHMGTNHLGHFLLTFLLLPALQQAGSADWPSRIIMVTSVVHFCCGQISAEDPHLAAPKAYSPLQGYSQSKFAQVVFAIELRKRLPPDGSVAAFACHPGECLTDISRNLPRWMYLGAKMALPRILLTPEKGSLSSLVCATSNPALQHHQAPDAAYINCGCKVQRPARLALDSRLGEWLWRWSCRQVGLQEPFDLRRQ